MSKILVTGATGPLGKEVVNQLLKKVKASDLSILVRDASKAEDFKTKGVNVIVGSYDDYNSLVSAFKGIDKLYFVSGSEIVARIKQHENIVNAAKEAGVKHVVYTSFQRKNETATSPIAIVADAHLKTEEWLKKSGLKYTILKHGVYLDMLPVFFGDKVLETSTIYLPAGEGKGAYILRNDLAELGAVILTTEGHENKVYDAVSDQANSFSVTAKELSEITGKTINYVSPSKEEYIKTLTSAGVPMEYAGIFAGFSEAIKQGEFEDTSSDFEKLVGRKPISVKRYLSEVYSK